MYGDTLCGAPYLGPAGVQQRPKHREADARRAEHHRGAVQQRQDVHCPRQRLTWALTTVSKGPRVVT